MSLMAVVAFTATLSACSLDTVIWGTDGARVIDMTEQVIEAAASGEPDPLACAGTTPDFGQARDWEALSAGEPERFHAEYWDKQVPLDPEWNINLEWGGPPPVSGQVIPGDVFFREDADGLCVVDISWSTVVG